MMKNKSKMEKVEPQMGLKVHHCLLLAPTVRSLAWPQARGGWASAGGSLLLSCSCGSIRFRGAATVRLLSGRSGARLEADGIEREPLLWRLE